VSGSPDIFFEPETVTFTGIFRAKGNEAAMVYVINADDCYTGFSAEHLARVRNQLFTAITRSKAWVRVLGVGENMNKLTREYKEVADRNFRLEFTYPDEENRKRLRIIARDLRRSQSRRRRSKSAEELWRLVRAIEEGEVYIEDLPLSTRRKLQELFRTR
jgi:superfamily I DNA and RNA helicase